MMKNRYKIYTRSAMRIIIYVVPIICLTLVSSCKKKHIRTYDFEHGQWIKEDTLEFEFNINDALKKYNLSFFFRNNLNYSYQNLFLLIDLSYDNRIIETDTVEYRITDKYGQWLGHGLGEIKDNYLMFNENIVFKKEGVYKITVRHGMRQNPLIGVNKFGFKTEQI